MNLFWKKSDFFSGLAQNFWARAAVARHFPPPPSLSKHPGAAPGCMYVCMYACMYVCNCMYVYMYMYVCMYVCTCLYGSMHACMHINV